MLARFTEVESVKRADRPELAKALHLASVTDRLRSYGSALKNLARGDDGEMGRWLNNRAENSHLPFRRREPAMLRFRRMRTLQKFGSVHAAVHNHFPTERHLQNRDSYKLTRAADLAERRGLLATLNRSWIWVIETGSLSSDSPAARILDLA